MTLRTNQKGVYNLIAKTTLVISCVLALTLILKINLAVSFGIPLYPTNYDTLTDIGIPLPEYTTTTYFASVLDGTLIASNTLSVYENVSGPETIYTYVSVVDPSVGMLHNISRFSAQPIAGFNGVAGYSFSDAFDAAGFTIDVQTLTREDYKLLPEDDQFFYSAFNDPYGYLWGQSHAFAISHTISSDAEGNETSKIEWELPSILNEDFSTDAMPVWWLEPDPITFFYQSNLGPLGIGTYQLFNCSTGGNTSLVPGSADVPEPLTLLLLGSGLIGLGLVYRKRNLVK